MTRSSQDGQHKNIITYIRYACICDIAIYECHKSHMSALKQTDGQVIFLKMKVLSGIKIP